MSRVSMVTGAARGIGLELCRQLLDAGDQVVACPRRPGSEGLDELASSAGDRLRVVPMDVGDPSSVDTAASEIAGQVSHIDLLFNNAAIYPKDEGGLESLDLDNLIRAFDVNAVGGLRVVRAVLPLMRRGEGKRVINVTSLMGSMGDNSSGGSYAYRMSKAALNMAARNLAHELGREGFISLCVHPGWVQTRMGGPAAPMDLSEATSQIIRTTLEATPADNGTFKGPGGRPLPF